MDINVDDSKTNDSDQTVFFTFTDDDLTEYKWHGDIPTGADAQTYLSSRMEKIKIAIYRKLYPGMPVFGTWDEVEQWIKDGQKIITGYDEQEQPIYKVIEKIPWTQTHPDIFPATPAEKTTMLSNIKDLLDNLTYSDLDDHIDTVFSNLNTAQKNSLKKLYKAVFYLLKGRG